MRGVSRVKFEGLPRIDLTQPYGIFSAALVMIFHFSDSLFKEIDQGLTTLYGEHWQKRLQQESLLVKDFNRRDPQAVLKEIARNGNSQFRLPLNAKIPVSNRGNFYNGVDDLLGERNAWVHRQIEDNFLELFDLAKTTHKLLEICGVFYNYPQWVDELKNQSDEAVNITNSENTEIRMEATMPINLDEKNDFEFQVGDPVPTRFLSHSYLVGEDGEIYDRNSNAKLSVFNPKSQSTLGVLTKELRAGSRLRITQEGYLCSFFDDHWGYLTKISPTDWFPNHLR